MTEDGKIGCQQLSTSYKGFLLEKVGRNITYTALLPAFLLLLAGTVGHMSESGPLCVLIATCILMGVGVWVALDTHGKPYFDKLRKKVLDDHMGGARDVPASPVTESYLQQNATTVHQSVRSEVADESPWWRIAVTIWG